MCSFCTQNHVYAPNFKITACFSFPSSITRILITVVVTLQALEVFTVNSSFTLAFMSDPSDFYSELNVFSNRIYSYFFFKTVSNLLDHIRGLFSILGESFFIFFSCVACENGVFRLVRYP